MSSISVLATAPPDPRGAFTVAIGIDKVMVKSLENGEGCRDDRNAPVWIGRERWTS